MPVDGTQKCVACFSFVTSLKATIAAHQVLYICTILQALRAQVYYLRFIQGEMESEPTALCRTELFWKQPGKTGLGVPSMALVL